MRSVVGGLIALAASAANAALAAQTIDTLQLESRIFANTRSIRVAVPPGYHEPANASVRYPVLYLNDGSMAFRDEAIGAPAVVRRLILAGEIEPLILVGIDNGGSTNRSTDPARDRANEFLPYPDVGFGPKNLYAPKPPAPNGARYPEFLATEVMPLIARRYRVLAGPEHTGIGGFSYGGVAALFTAMTRPGFAERLLLESTPLWIGPDRQLLGDAARVTRWPRRIYLGLGEMESPEQAVREEGARDCDSLVALINRAPGGLRVTLHREVTPGAKHEPTAWRARLPAALRFLFGTDSSRSRQ